MNPIEPTTQDSATTTQPPAASQDTVEPVDAAAEAELYCPGCAYDLRALQGDACPECGIVIDLVNLRTSSIPWVVQDERGRVRGFLRTCWWVTFSPTPFCREVSRPVALGPARLFRLCVVALALLSLMFTVFTLWLFSNDFNDFIDFEDFHAEFAHAFGVRPLWAYVALPLLTLMFLYGLTGIHLDWLYPSALPDERQHRAVALGHYACGPLAWLPLCVALYFVGALIERQGGDPNKFDYGLTGMLIMGLGMIGAFVCVALFWNNTWVIAGKAAQRSGLTQLAMAFALPVLWLVWAAIVFGVIPLVVGYVAIAIITW